MADAAVPSSGRVFISYRREETDYAAALLVRELAKRIGRGQIFQDIDSIRPGDDFVEVITTAVASCRVLLAVIDRQWLGGRDDQGRPRLENPNDFVRLEIEAALTRKVRVIPILIGGAPMPSREELPQSLAKFARLQALELSPGHLESGTSRLQQVVDEALADVHPTRDPEPPSVPPPTEIEGSNATPSREPRRSRRLLVWITAAVLVVVAAAGGAWWLHANTTTTKTPAAAPPTAAPPTTAPPTTTPPTTTPLKTTPLKTTPPTTQPSKTPAPVQPPLTSGVAVVTQYYQDVSDKNYAAAWAIGGSNIAAENGQTYASWVAGYTDTTASISITSYGTRSNGTVWCYISAVQHSGAVNTYYGTYTVANGVIVSASIRQVG